MNQKTPPSNTLETDAGTTLSSLTTIQRTPKLLLILDGFGIRESHDSNAIAGATTPHFDKLWNNQNHRRLLSASGLDVGLPPGQMGNSEVGHMNIGAGRILYQDLTKISKAITENALTQNTVLTNGVNVISSQHKALHILGLLSPGGVHSHEDHIFALAQYAKEQGIQTVYVHAFLDGRDTPPKSAQASIERLQQHLDALSSETQHLSIATVCGRFYAMDRDSRWERVEEAFNAIVLGQVRFQAENALEGLQQAYNRDETDEFVQSTRTNQQYSGVNPGDGILFANFRSDRAKELSAALFNQSFDGFKRTVTPELSCKITMTAYSDDIEADVAYPSEVPSDTLGEVISQANLRQLRLAETEKYAHVTFFMNAGLDQPWPQEERLLVASPNVRTYDEAPGMSLEEVTDKLCSALENKTHDMIICNFANADMVGHTGDYDAAVKAIESIDASLARVITSLAKVQGEALITADHGNAEQMADPTTSQPHTAHTSEPVPLIYVGPRSIQWHSVEDARLSDIAPSLLYLRGISQPSLMTGRCLLKASLETVN